MVRQVSRRAGRSVVDAFDGRDDAGLRRQPAVVAPDVAVDRAVRDRRMPAQPRAARARAARRARWPRLAAADRRALYALGRRAAAATGKRSSAPGFSAASRSTRPACPSRFSRTARSTSTPHRHCIRFPKSRSERRRSRDRLAPPLVAAGLFGAIVGSFLNVCIYRLPRGASVVWPASACPHCERALAWYENIPVVSYLALAGRCRTCREPISARYPIVEVLTGADVRGRVVVLRPGAAAASRVLSSDAR